MATRRMTTKEIRQLHGWEKVNLEMLKRQKKARKKTSSNLRKVKKKGGRTTRR